MNDTEAQKIVAEIAGLKVMADELEREADVGESLTNVSWAQFGLKPDNIPPWIVINRNTAKVLKEKALFLELYLGGKIDYNPESLKGRILEINSQIEACQNEKGDLYLKLALFRFLREVIDGGPDDKK